MILRDVSFQNPVENLLFDELLLARAEAAPDGKECLRFWESPVDFVVLGRVGKPEEEVDGLRIRIPASPNGACASGVPVFRRGSGGGTVLQGPGCLNFSLVLARSRHPSLADISRSYVFLLGEVVAVLRELGVPAKFFPVSDLALETDRRKFSGNAQKRGRRFLLHHGTLLHAFDLDKIPKFLKEPKQAPAYRADRTHADFVTNVAVDVAAFKAKLAERFGAVASAASGHALTADERAELDRQVHLQEKERQLSVEVRPDPA